MPELLLALPVVTRQLHVPQYPELVELASEGAHVRPTGALLVRSAKPEAKESTFQSKYELNVGQGRSPKHSTSTLFRVNLNIVNPSGRLKLSCLKQFMFEGNHAGKLR